MLTVNQLNKKFNLNTVLKDITFTLKDGDRVGLIGVNGCGKTTLLKIITGEITPDSGTVQFVPPDLRVGYLPQGLLPDENDTIEGFLSGSHSSIDDVQAEFEQVSIQIASNPDNPALHQRYDQLLELLSTMDHTQIDAAELLNTLGLGDYPGDTPIDYLSGGQKTRLALASVLLSRPKILLLDEPTNHLDIEMLEWLEEWLSHYKGAVLMVSHDRAFLDKTVNGILRIDTRDHTLKFYEGNYSNYFEQRLEEQEREWQAYQDQQDQIASLNKSITHVRSLAKKRKGGKSDVASGTDGFSAGFFKDRSLETLRRAKALENRLEKLMTDEHIDKPKADWEMKMDFSQVADSGRDVLILEDLSIGYDGTPLLEHLNLILRFGRRATLIGPNGCGKSTLIKTITGQLMPIHGNARLGANVKLGYMAQEQENLDPALNPFETVFQRTALNETETRYFLSKYLFKGDDVFKSNQALSFGERARLTLACLVADGCNFLLLDEPINHLDIPSRSQFEQALLNFDGTVLAVVHDRYFIEQFANEIWRVKDDRIQQIFLDDIL
ncbi:MAG: ABC-F family ATP-binding cassette domain-containing protein [Anaerolineaceae bacterium]|nr:ABC-F family ATP-binding cassette domain-containing protein [Anaerolineaceae bacterium]